MCRRATPARWMDHRGRVLTAVELDKSVLSVSVGGGVGSFGAAQALTAGSTHHLVFE